MQRNQSDVLTLTENWKLFKQRLEIEFDIIYSIR